MLNYVWIAQQLSGIIAFFSDATASPVGLTPWQDHV
jgi:hypothetical protein